MDPKQISVLIGEDEAIIALDTQVQLRGIGYRVKIETGTPNEVVLLARELKPDVIVLDLNIHGDRTGFEIAREIHGFATIPIVFVSACPADVFRNELAIPRPYRYLTKPFILARLHAAIQELIR